MAKEKAAPAEKEAPKYTVANLSEDLGKEPADVRVMLRKSTVEKPGAVWGWDKKSEYDAVLKELKAMGSKPKAEKAPPAKAEKAPAKTEKPKAAKAAGSKKAKADA